TGQQVPLSRNIKRRLVPHSSDIPNAYVSKHYENIDRQNTESSHARVQGFYPKLTLKPRHGRGKGKKVSMNAYYKYQLHPRVNKFGLIFKGGRLFQQYVVSVFFAIEQSRLDFIRTHQNDIRSDYLSCLYDAVSRGDREGIAVGSKIMLPTSFTRGPWYMYSHYLDVLAICRSLGNPQFFITFTCNVNWPEIKRYMEQYPEPTPIDRADIVCRVFEQKVKDFVKFLLEVKTFGYVTGGSGYQQKDRKPSQNDKTEHGMEKTVQNQGQSPKMPKSESILKNQQSNRSRN
ncbi:DNA helicase, partial [Tanacetum coccineum]